MKLSQSSPDSRFSLLLQQHRYEEATEIATKYNHDLQPLFQHKVIEFYCFFLSNINRLVSSLKKC